MKILKNKEIFSRNHTRDIKHPAHTADPVLYPDNVSDASSFIIIFSTASQSLPQSFLSKFSPGTITTFSNIFSKRSNDNESPGSLGMVTGRDP
jgi:hypothetical protein